MMGLAQGWRSAQSHGRRRGTVAAPRMTETVAAHESKLTHSRRFFCQYACMPCDRASSPGLPCVAPSQACQFREGEQGIEAGPSVGAYRAGLQGRHQEPPADRRRAEHQRGGDPQACQARRLEAGPVGACPGQGRATGMQGGGMQRGARGTQCVPSVRWWTRMRRLWPPSGWPTGAAASTQHAAHGPRAALKGALAREDLARGRRQ